MTDRNIIVVKQGLRELVAHEHIKIGGYSFEFKCDLNGGRIIGFNKGLCIRMFTGNGWTELIDNNYVGLDIPDFEKNHLKDLNKIFNAFEKYLVSLLHLSNLEIEIMKAGSKK